MSSRRNGELAMAADLAHRDQTIVEQTFDHEWVRMFAGVEM